MERGLVPFHDTYVIIIVVTIEWSVIFILSPMPFPDGCLCSWWYNSHTVRCMVSRVHSCEKLMHLVLWIKPGAYQLVFSRSFTSAESLSWLFVSCYAGFIYQPKGLVPFLFGLCAGLEFCFRLSIDRLFPSHLVRWNPHGISGRLGSCCKQTSNQKVNIVNTPYLWTLHTHGRVKSTDAISGCFVLCIVMLPSMCLF